MKKFKKILSILYHFLKFIFILLAFLSIFSYLAFYYLLNHYFSQKELKALVISQIQEAFLRPASVESVSFDPYGRIQIKGLMIYSKGYQKFFIKCSRIIGIFSPYSLFSGKIEVKNIKMISPEIFLRRNEDGTWRFEDILSNWKNKKSGFFKISNIEVEDGKISVEDMKNSLFHVFEKIDFFTDLSSSSEYSNFTISTDFKTDYLKTKEPSRFFLNADFKHGKTLKDCSLENINSSLSIDEKIYSAKGKIENLYQPSGILKLDVPGTNLKNIINIKDNLEIPGSTIIVKFHKIENSRSYSFSFVSEKLKASASAIISYSHNKFPYSITCLIKKLPAEKIKMTLSPFISNPSGTLDLDIKLSRDIKGNKKWNIYSSFSDMSFWDKEKIFNFNNVCGKIVINDSFKALNILSADMRAGENEFTKINFKWEAHKNIEKMEGFSLLNDKKMAFRATIKDNDSPSREGEFSIYVKKTKIEEILSLINHIAEIKKKKPTKIGDEKYNFTGKKIKIFYHSDEFENNLARSKKLYAQAIISDFQTDFKKINGNFVVKAENGIFMDVQKNSEKNNLYHLISLPITTIYRLNRVGSLRINSSVDDVSFFETAADYSLNNGKIVLNSFYIHGKEFMTHTSGEIDFMNENLNLNVRVVNNKFYSSGGLPEALTDSKGRPAIAFRLKGKFRDNNIKILDPNDNPEIIKKAIDKGVVLQEEKFINSEGKWLK